MIEISDSKYSRFELISWWKQEILSDAHVLVIGGGALGNEIAKNLAMTGVGHIYIVDMDKVELSNLSRSVLFRKSDLNKPKAKAISLRAKEINDDISVKYFDDAVQRLGLGIFGKMDIVICGLDNREARMYVNQCCRKISKVWIDGAIEELSGIARMFSWEDDSPCYECTLSEVDYKIINKRKSCMMLGLNDIYEGKIPTTPTISSIIAGIEVQEALKFLHNKDNPSLLKGRAFVFQGNINDSYIIDYQKRDDCIAHYNFGEIINAPQTFNEATLNDVHDFGKKYFGEENFVIEFNNEIVYQTDGETFFRDLSLLTEGEMRSDKGLRNVKSFHNLSVNSDLFNYLRHFKLKDIAVPLNDILTIKCKDKRVHVQFGYDDIFKSAEN